MPYELRHDGPKEKPYCVYNSETGERKGCSATEEEGKKHMSALYANEKEAMNIVDLLKELLTNIGEPILAFVSKIGNIGGKKPRSELADSDFVFSDTRTFPVVTPADVSDAVSSWGRYKGKHSFEEFKRRLTALCKRKGAKFVAALPDSWEKKEASFSVYKSDEGLWRWAAVSSTGFLDRDQEIVASAALAKAVTAEEGDFGPLCYWHEYGIPIGKCDTHFVEGVCLIESGTWSDEPWVDTLREYVKEHSDDFGISIRFKTSLSTADRDTVINGVPVKNVFNDIEIIERSLLPAERASNVFTMIEAKGGADVREEKLALLRKVIGQKAADKIAGTVDVLNEFAASPDAVVKENDTATEEVVEAVAEPVVETEKSETTEVVTEVITETATEPIKEETTEDKEMPTNRVSMPGEQSSVNDVESPAEVVMVEEAPLQALRMWAQTLPEAKQKELAPIIIALADKLEAKDNEADEQEPEEPEKPEKPGVTSSDDPTSTPPNQQDNTTKKEEETVVEPVIDEEFKNEIRTSLADLATKMANFATELATLKETAEKQKQEAMPRGVLQRVFSDPSSAVTKEEQDKLVVKGQDNSPVAAMTATVLSRISGGI